MSPAVVSQDQHNDCYCSLTASNKPLHQAPHRPQHQPNFTHPSQCPPQHPPRGAKARQHRRQQRHHSPTPPEPRKSCPHLQAQHHKPLPPPISHPQSLHHAAPTCLHARPKAPGRKAGERIAGDHRPGQIVGRAELARRRARWRRSERCWMRAGGLRGRGDWGWGWELGERVQGRGM